MLDKIITTLEPFAIGLVILAGASLAGWVKFSNPYVVGIGATAAGILLMLGYAVKQFRATK